MRIHQLQHFAFGNRVGRVRHHFLDAQVTELDHHLERAGVQVIPDQHARLAAEDLVRGVTAAAHVGAVDDVVVQQRGGMDELDDRGRRDVLAAVVTTRFCCQYDTQRAQSLAAAADDVLRNLVDQHDVAGQALYDGQVDTLQVFCDERPDLFELHSRDKPPAGLDDRKPGMVPVAPRLGNGASPLSA